MGMPSDARSAPRGGPRLLLVSRWFPPHSDPTSYRWLRFVTALAQRGWTIDVLTVQPEPHADYYDEGLLDLVPPEVTIHRVYAGLYQGRIDRWRRRSPPATGAVAGGGARPARPGPVRLLRQILKTPDHLIGPLKFPDPTFEWIPWGARRGIALHRERAYDLLVSSSAPFSSHVVAARIRRACGIPWVGDFSDPFIDTPFVRRPRWRLALDRRLEASWMRALDAMIVPTQEMADLCSRQYPVMSPARVHVVSYGYPEELYASLEPRRLEGFTIVHTGVFYADLRDPTPFFRGLSQVRDLPIRVHHAGGLHGPFQDEIQRLGIGHLIVQHGFLPRREAAALQMGGSCLLLIGNKGGVQLPGKLLDYFGAGRPVLALRNDAHDIAADLVAHTGAGLVVENEPAAIAGALRSLVGWWQAGDLDGRFNTGVGREFAWSRQEEKLAGVLARYASAPGRPDSARG